MERKDIQNEADIKTLIDEFYAKALKDELLGPIFIEVAHIDLPHHLPILYSFWEMIILGKQGYTGQPYPKHIPLGINSTHFERWLMLFEQTIHENFHGLNAELTLQKAKNIGRLFSHKLQEERA